MEAGADAMERACGRCVELKALAEDREARAEQLLERNREQQREVELRCAVISFPRT